MYAERWYDFCKDCTSYINHAINKMNEIEEEKKRKKKRKKNETVRYGKMERRELRSAVRIRLRKY